MTTMITTPIRTGRRGSRTRAEHARTLHIGRLKRRRQRRHSKPAVRSVFAFPRAELRAVSISLTNVAKAFAGVGKAFADGVAAARPALAAFTAGLDIAIPADRRVVPVTDADGEMMMFGDAYIAVGAPTDEEPDRG